MIALVIRCIFHPRQWQAREDAHRQAVLDDLWELAHLEALWNRPTLYDWAEPEMRTW